MRIRVVALPVFDLSLRHLVHVEGSEPYVHVQRMSSLANKEFTKSLEGHLEEMGIDPQSVEFAILPWDQMQNPESIKSLF